MTDSNDLLGAALAYAERGWPVLPCEVRGKRPLGRLVPHGLKDATTDAAVIRGWWRSEPTANVGLVTGIAFDVLDVDGEEGQHALAAVVPAEASVVVGPTVTTGRGSHHYVAVTGHGNRAGLASHVDWRGRGGYVIAPPSIHPSGVPYRWAFGELDVDYGATASIRSAPAWVLKLLAPQALTPRTAERRVVSSGTYARRALEGEVGKVVLAPVGQRNHTLNQAAFSLGQLIAGGVLDVDEVIEALLLAASRCGLEETESRATIASGLLAGSAHPRGIRA